MSLCEAVSLRSHSNYELQEIRRMKCRESFGEGIATNPVNEVQNIGRLEFVTY